MNKTTKTSFEIQERAKELVNQILMITSGGVPAHDEVGQLLLLELFEIFQIKQDDFYPTQLAEELTYALFHFTHSHDDAYRKWRKDILKNTDLENFYSEEAEQIEQTLDLSGMSAESLNTDDCKASEATDGQLAQIVSGLLHNPNLPEPMRDGLKDALIDTFNCHIDQTEHLSYEESPEYIELVLRGFEAKRGAAKK